MASQNSKANVAVKRINKSALQPHDHAALKNEVGILAECKGQSNVLTYLGFYEDAHFYYVVTEEVHELFSVHSSSDVTHMLLLSVPQRLMEESSSSEYVRKRLTLRPRRESW